MTKEQLKELRRAENAMWRAQRKFRALLAEVLPPGTSVRWARNTVSRVSRVIELKEDGTVVVADGESFGSRNHITLGHIAAGMKGDA